MTTSRDRDAESLIPKTQSRETSTGKECELPTQRNEEEDTNDYEGHLFSTFLQLLRLPVFTRAVWSGLVTSIGGLTLSVVSFDL